MNDMRYLSTLCDACYFHGKTMIYEYESHKCLNSALMVMESAAMPINKDHKLFVEAEESSFKDKLISAFERFVAAIQRFFTGLFSRMKKVDESAPVVVTEKEAEAMGVIVQIEPNVETLSGYLKKKDWFGAIKYSIKKIPWKTLIGTIVAAIAVVGTYKKVKEVTDEVTQTVNKAKETVDTAKQTATAVKDTATAAVQGAVDTAKKAASSAKETAVSTAKAASKEVKDAAKATATAASDAAKVAVKSASETAKKVKESPAGKAATKAVEDTAVVGSAVTKHAASKVMENDTVRTGVNVAKAVGSVAGGAAKDAGRAVTVKTKKIVETIRTGNKIGSICDGLSKKLGKAKGVLHKNSVYDFLDMDIFSEAGEDDTGDALGQGLNILMELGRAIQKFCAKLYSAYIM